MRPTIGCWSTIAVFFGIACGTDQQGTGSVPGGHSVSDAGAAATSGSDSAGGTGEGAASSTSDGAAPTNADATDDGPGMTGVDGGTGSTSHDGATADAVAVLSADGAVLCGPCSQGQQCDPTTQQCVQCTSGADCAGTSTPACARNMCVQCATSADCSGATPYCTSGGDNPWQCVECLQNGHCSPNKPSCNGGVCGKAGG